MALRVTEEQVFHCMKGVCASAGLEPPLLFYYTYDMGPLWKRFLMAGGMLQAFVWKYYYLAISGEKLVLQRIGFTQKLLGEPVVIPFRDMEVKSVRRKMLFSMVNLETKENVYRFTLVRKIGGWMTSKEQQEHIVKLFEGFLTGCGNALN